MIKDVLQKMGIKGDENKLHSPRSIFTKPRSGGSMPVVMPSRPGSMMFSNHSPRPGSMAISKKSPRPESINQSPRGASFGNQSESNLPVSGASSLSSLADQDALIKNAISEHRIFTSFSEKEKHYLIRAFNDRKVKKGEYIIKEGVEGDLFYIISNGQFSIIKNNEHLASLESGKCFGESALKLNSSSSPSVTTIRAETNGYLFTLHRDAFLFILEGSRNTRRRI
eukprot:gene12008-25158_t